MSRTQTICLSCRLRSFENEVLERLKFELNCKLRLVQLMNSGSSIQIDDEQVPMTSPRALQKISYYAYGIGPALKLFLEPGSACEVPEASSLAENVNRYNLATFPYTFRDENMPEGMDFAETVRFFCRVVKPSGIMTDFPDRVLKILEEDYE